MVTVVKRTFGPTQDRIPENPQHRIIVGEMLIHTHTPTYTHTNEKKQHDS